MKKQNTLIIGLVLSLGSSTLLSSSAPAAQVQVLNPQEEFCKSLYTGVWKEFNSVLTRLNECDKYQWVTADINFDRLHNHIIPDQLQRLALVDQELAYTQELKRFKPDFIKFQTQLAQGAKIKDVIDDCLKKYSERACFQCLVHWGELREKANEKTRHTPELTFDTVLDYEIYDTEKHAQKLKASAKSANDIIAFYKKIQPIRDWVERQMQQYIKKNDPTLNDFRIMMEDLEKHIHKWRTYEREGKIGHSKSLLVAEIIKDVVDSHIRQYQLNQILKQHLPHPGVAEMVGDYEYHGTVEEKKEKAEKGESTSSVPGALIK